ncbi:hypothetical protein K505DRAFT_344509 [Melanomma pulvis-pyrius CBS 109.77]|uniref:Uncharacterized protein n=1 Tax=Melanomma pulvis-pyrius CBS 109.77 TaxID=1314802 RepID=A0A6A6WNF0_9PLEO|nr:hypothetical protein K505DRAFT_344509 [Melanomma pulvis-pyrius CBS 109.77]
MASFRLPESGRPTKRTPAFRRTSGRDSPGVGVFCAFSLLLVGQEKPEKPWRYVRARHGRRLDSVSPSWPSRTAPRAPAVQSCNPSLHGLCGTGSRPDSPPESASRIAPSPAWDQP